MSKIHPHIATAYERQAAAKGRLRAIILPLLPEIEDRAHGWKYWSSGLFETTLAFAPDEVPFSYAGNYAQLKLQKDDRIYLAEKWCKGDWGAAFDDDIYFLESTTPEAENIGWQPPETMPPEAAEHWYAIAGVRVCQCKDLDFALMAGTGIHSACSGIDYPERETAMVWDEAYPQHPWQGDRWVVALTVEAIVR